MDRYRATSSENLGMLNAGKLLFVADDISVQVNLISLA
jgi:hypothetical protein